MSAIADIVRQDQTERLFFTFKSEGLPDAELKVREFTLVDRVFSPYQLDVALVSEWSDLDLTVMMDKPGLVTVHDRYDEKKRYFHGVVAAAERGDSGRRHTMYRLTLKPALHRLGLVADCKIYQAKPPEEIIKEILQDNGIADYRFYLQYERPRREYCVKYNETELAFIERLMAEEGMSYSHWFEEDKHILVITDRTQSAARIDDDKIEYNAVSGGAVTGPHIRSFRWREQVRPTRVSLRDRTFRAPRALLEEQYRPDLPPGHACDYEMYGFPGRHKTEEVGQRFAQFRLEGLRCEANLGTGEGYCPHMQAGMAFTLTEHDDKKLNREYFLVEANHHGTQPGALEEDAGIADDAATQEIGTRLITNFRAIPVTTPWRPEQRTKPQADGPHIAVVTAPEGETTVYTDEHGRVRVWFPWDRHGQQDDTSSCWIRVSQAWGGATFGTMAIPRVGQEVIVDYLNQDLDQPIVVGRTYHAANISPYKLPDHKSKMVIRSDSFDGKGGFNELSLTDTVGEENMFLHAEKDQTLKVKNNQIAAIDASALQTIGEHQSVTVGKNLSQQIGGGMNVVVGAAGGAAAALLTSAMAGLTGHSASLLQKGMAIAGESAGGGSGGNPLSGFMSALASGGGSALSQLAGGLDSALGGISGAAQYALRSGGGASMASAGSSLAGSLASLIGGGVLNQLVSTSLNQTTGGTASEQVGLVKVTTVGKVFMESVGHTKKISVGKEFALGVGGKDGEAAASLTMKDDGTITLKGAKILIEASGPIIHVGKVIDLN